MNRTDDDTDSEPPAGDGDRDGAAPSVDASAPAARDAAPDAETRELDAAPSAGEPEAADTDPDATAVLDIGDLGAGPSGLPVRPVNPDVPAPLPPPPPLVAPDPDLDATVAYDRSALTGDAPEPPEVPASLPPPPPPLVAPDADLDATVVYGPSALAEHESDAPGTPAVPGALPPPPPPVGPDLDATVAHDENGHTRDGPAAPDTSDAPPPLIESELDATVAYDVNALIEDAPDASDAPPPLIESELDATVAYDMRALLEDAPDAPAPAFEPDADASARLHPRARSARDAHPRLRSTLTGLERCHLTLRTLARAVLDRTYFMPLPEQSAAYTTDQRAALADLLTTAAAAIDSIIPIATGTNPDTTRLDVEAHLTELDTQRHRINTLLTVDPQTDQAAWKQHGALLASIDRLRVEIAAAAHPPDEVNPPGATHTPLVSAPVRPPGR